MPGATTSVFGATGQAPTTVWFGKIPDQLNMLLPRYFFKDGVLFTNGVVQLNYNACNYASQMVPWDTRWGGGDGAAPASPTCSIGATATAPDGTSTAVKVVESTTNSYHFLTAGCHDIGSFDKHTKRFAAFVKAGERSRCWMAITNAQFGVTGDSGVRAVFDLAGGQVAVAPTAYGTDTEWAARSASIKSFGDGWYLCTIDVGLSGNFSFSVTMFSCAIGPDSGSGTGAISATYAGNGTSGIYVWRVNLLPPRAWGLNNTVFYDDFTDDSMAEFDLTNSKASGFKWYVNGFYAAPGYEVTIFPTITTPADFSVASSVLTIERVDPLAVAEAYQPSTIAYLGTNSYVGTVFQPSACWQARCSMAYRAYPNDGGSGSAFWMVSIEYILQPLASTVHDGFGEVDLFELGRIVNYYTPTAAMFDQGVSNIISQNISLTGVPVWDAVKNYAANRKVYYNAQLYNSLVGSNLGFQPDISPTKWAVYTVVVDGGGFLAPDTAHTIGYDHRDMNTYSYLWLIDNSHYGDLYDTGELLQFCNGVLCCSLSSPTGQNVYGRLSQESVRTFAHSDHLHYPILFLSGRDTDIKIDWVSLIQ